MEMGVVSENAWWMIPENFDAPLVLFIDQSQEELIFGHGDLYLRRIEEHSSTFIQLEAWFTASGQTRVSVVGPLRARQWLMDMIWSLGSQENYHQARGQQMLLRVQNQPLTTVDLDAALRVQTHSWGLSPVIRSKGPI
ncbi:KH homology domain-containing protein 1-like [Acomys russatus]|uniref:KH homology domain-containing protein 1-like n=1 Tax=Acomys russatus TaxID=60746 RepID=UPI0021E2F303|nr:KH homology domain-containing protein 1-like [Acomys russatus]